MSTESRHIKVDGSVIDIEPKNGTDFKSEELKEIIGGYAALIKLKDGFVLVVNEDGLVQGLSHNKKASKIAGMSIVGDVIHTKKNLIY